MSRQRRILPRALTLTPYPSTAPTLVVTCEHGGHRVPPAFRRAFRGRASLLASHRGFDAGALATARSLARRFSAPLHATTVSRLVVDTNRSLGHPRLFSEPMRQSSAEARARALAEHYVPHRERVEATIAAIVRERAAVLHVASHSFVPELDSVPRTADVAWLYDPARALERDFVDAWRRALRRLDPELRLRRNYPYRGISDGFTTYLRRRFPASSYAGIELEVNQASTSTRLRRALVLSLGAVLEDSSSS